MAAVGQEDNTHEEWSLLVVSYEHGMFSDEQKPQVGCTLSHLVFLARHTWQARRLLFRGYLGSEKGCLGRLPPVERSALGSGRPADSGLLVPDIDDGHN